MPKESISTWETFPDKITRRICCNSWCRVGGRGDEWSWELTRGGLRSRRTIHVHIATAFSISGPESRVAVYSCALGSAIAALPVPLPSTLYYTIDGDLSRRWLSNTLFLLITTLCSLIVRVFFSKLLNIDTLYAVRRYISHRQRLYFDSDLLQEGGLMNKTVEWGSKVNYNLF